MMFMFNDYDDEDEVQSCCFPPFPGEGKKHNMLTGAIAILVIVEYLSLTALVFLLYTYHTSIYSFDLIRLSLSHSLTLTNILI